MNPNTPDAKGRLGIVLWEKWEGIRGRSVDSLIQSKQFLGPPSEANYLTALSSLQAMGDDFGVRIRGYLVAPESGLCTIAITSDDSSELWVSSDERKFNRKRVAAVHAWSGYGQWDQQFHWKSLEHLFTDKVMANTVPTTLYSFAQFRSTNTTNMRVLPTPASAAAHTLTFYGDWTGDADGQAHHNQKVFFDDLRTTVDSNMKKYIISLVLFLLVLQGTWAENPNPIASREDINRILGITTGIKRSKNSCIPKYCANIRE